MDYAMDTLIWIYLHYIVYVSRMIKCKVIFKKFEPLNDFEIHSPQRRHYEETKTRHDIW